jgi:trimeric autotransporter adhesin
MEAKIKLLAILVFASTVVSLNKSNAQAYSYTVGIAIPPHDEVQSTQGILDILQGTGSSAGTPALIGLGVNQDQPAYMLDILCDPTYSTKNDINISTTGATQNVGYRIGGNMVLWHAGDVSNIYVGVGAGSGPGNTNMVCIGNDANHNGGTPISDDVFIGYDAGILTGTRYNTFVGSQAGNANTNGEVNTFIGAYTGTTNTVGSENVALGYLANFSTNNLSDAISIGYNSIATHNSNMILGDNSINVGIGMSNITGGPTNKLDISYYSLSTPDPGGTPPASTYTGLVGSGTATGSSGLQFRDLTTASYQYPYVTNQGFLTVDDNGNVVYMQAPTPTSSTGSFGACPLIPNLAVNEGLNLNSYNLCFAGNSAGAASDNLLIGYNCPTTYPAKLSVLQASGSRNTTGIYVENDDLSNGTFGNAKPVIGIKSYVPSNSTCDAYNVAGWFEADYTTACIQWAPYAIFIPNKGGNEAIGWKFPTHQNNPTHLLDINGGAWSLSGWHVYSDSILKKNVTAFNSGIKVIRQLNLKSYKYNGLGGFDTTDTHIGVLAQNLNRAAHYAVTGTVIYDTATSDTLTVMGISQDAVLYTAINAIKQVDSAVRSNAHIDSNVSNTMWSLNGNALTTPSFVGTTNANPLQFKVDGSQSGWMDYGTPYTTFLGYKSGNANTGIDNQGFGYEALLSNTSGTNNNAFGYKALLSNTTGYDNDAHGYEALQNNVGGAENVAMGYWSLPDNTSGNNNTAIGYEALLLNTTASKSTAVGSYAMYNNTASSNTATGYEAGYTNTTGVGNTYLGYDADASGVNYGNSVALGNGTSITANNQVNIGNTSVTTIQGQVNYTTYSDRRIKTNIQNNVPGLAFINKLHPVTYNLNIHQQNTLLGLVDSISNNNTDYWNHKYDIENIVFTGLIAQQVDSAANQVGYNFSGIQRPSAGNPLYGLKYSEFVVPLIQAVQQLSASKDSMRTKLDSVQNTLDSLRSAIQSMQTCLTQLCADNHSGHHKSGGNNSGGDSNSTNNVQDVTLSSENAPLLYQNMPNPFSTGTKINYYLPQGTMGASIVFYDNYGNQIKTVQLSQTGNGTLNITPENLSNGIYSYSLMVNGNVIDTKRMVLQK